MGIQERNGVAVDNCGGGSEDSSTATTTIHCSATVTKPYSIGIYQPPAARKTHHNNVNSSSSETTAIALKNPATVKTIESKSLPLSSSPIQSSPENSNHCEDSLNSQRPRQRRPDRAVYVPRGRRSQTTPPTSSSIISKDSHPDQIRPTVINNTADHNTISLDEPVAPDQSNNCNETDNRFAHTDQSLKQQFLISFEGESVKHNCDHTTNHMRNTAAALNDKDIFLDTSTTATTNMSSHKVNHKNQCNINSNDAVPETRTSDKDNNEEKEFQRASKEINRSNRRIIKQTFNSDVLEISDPIIPSDTTTNESTKKTVKQSSKEAEVEEDDWESMFDDNGECVDAKVIDEITAAVGKVSITKPKSDYKMYKSPPVNLDAEEFPHVLEVSNFPVEFKTQDLMMLFSQYKESGFDIKWVDDTHALAVFSSSKIASEVLNMGHPFVRLKPLTQATMDSRAKAKKCAVSLQPYRQRPETCAALARRLVTGALGVRLSTAREELENERRVLREAKERKLLAAKLRDEAWEN